MKRYLILFCIVASISCVARAQAPTVRASVDKTDIIIGDPIRLELKVTAGKNEKIYWPLIRDSISAYIEAIQIGSIDTQLTASSQMLTQIITVSAYDSGRFEIPPFLFSFGEPEDSNDVYTQPVEINVRTLNVNENAGIRDIESPMDLPYSIREILPFVLILIGFVALSLTIFLIVRRALQSRPKKQIVVQPPVPARPPKEVALEQLEKWRGYQPTTFEETKFYYSQLAEIIREYIAATSPVYAQELVTREILQALEAIRYSSSSLHVLENLLRRADMVKFAKSHPGELENLESWNWAHQLISLLQNPEDNHVG